MKTFIAILFAASFVCFIIYRMKLNDKVNKALDAAMKKWTKNTDGG